MKCSFSKVILLLSVSISFFSCKKNVANLRLNVSDMETITFDLKDKTIENRDDIFKNIKCISLETKDKFLIGQIDELFFIDSTIVVVDKDISKAVFLFDNNGKFKSRVSFNGRGNHEYLQLTHVFMQNDTIAINDIIKREINFFDLNGKFLRTIQYEMPFNQVEWLGDNRIACNIYQGKSKKFSHLDDYSFVIMNVESDVVPEPVYAFGPDNSNPGMIMTRFKNLYSFDNHVYCSVNFENVIYELTKDSAVAKYKLELASGNLEDVTFKTTEEAMDYISNNPFFLGFYTELKDFSIFGISVPEEGVLQFIYDHKTKEAHLIPFQSQNPLFSFLSTQLFRYGENTVVAPVNSSRFVSFKKMLEGQGIQCVFENEEIENLTDESNPLLFYYEIQ